MICAIISKIVKSLNLLSSIIQYQESDGVGGYGGKVWKTSWQEGFGTAIDQHIAQPMIKLINHTQLEFTRGDLERQSKMSTEAAALVLRIFIDPGGSAGKVGKEVIEETAEKAVKEAGKVVIIGSTNIG